MVAIAVDKFLLYQLSAGSTQVTDLCRRGILLFLYSSNDFSAQFIKIISHYKKIGYSINVLQQTACLVVNPITVGNFAFLFNFTPVGRTSDSMMVPT